MRKVVLSCLVAYILGILAFETLSAAALMFTLLFVVTVVFIRYTFFWKKSKDFHSLSHFSFCSARVILPLQISYIRALRRSILAIP